MKNNIDSDKTTLPDKKKISLWRWLILIIIVGVVGYFGYPKMVDYLPEKIFTEYPPISNDTLIQSTSQDSILENIEILDSTSIDLEDSIEVILPQDSIDIVTTEIENPKPVEATTVDLFKVNTSYGKIDSATAVAASEVEIEPNKFSNLNSTTTDLFEELLIPENVDADFEKSFSVYSQSPIISSKSVLKLLSIVGKQILLGKNTDDVQDIIQTLTESDEVVGILIVERKGKVIYATNQKLINTAIQNIMPKIDIKSNSLSWYQEKNKTVAAIPLFHIYGKIGEAILVTRR